MTRRCVCVLMVVGLFACPRPAWCQWTSVGDGIEYRAYTVSGPNNVFVARMDRANLNCTLESTIAQGKLYTGRETVRSQATRYEQAINAWGQWGNRNHVVVAINGDFFNTTTGYPSGGQIQSGWYCVRFPEFGGWSGMAWTTNRDVFMGGCVNHPNAQQVIRFVANGTSSGITAINKARTGVNDMVIYTPQWDSNTHTDASGTEVLVELGEPLFVKPSSSVRGTVRQIRANLGSTPIPFDHIVLSGKGGSATLLNNLHTGDAVTINMEIRDYYAEGTSSAGGCSKRTYLDWTKTYALAGGNFAFLYNGAVTPTTNAGLIVRNPRTAVAFNDSYIYFIVVDGRSTISMGMTMTELASFCQSYLATPWGYNMDGGGSSTMVVNGQVMNVPSDGTERAVANGLMMINVDPRVQSTSFATDNLVRANGSASVLLGPGTNYESIATIAGGTQGTIVEHTLAGVQAKGQHWWKCDFAGTTGWVSEASLVFVSGERPPTITQQPMSRLVGAGTPVTFSVAASSTVPIVYQWQHNQANLADTGAYSGASTDTLSIAGAYAAEAGNYRCLVTNVAATIISDEVSLGVITPDLDGDSDCDMTDFAMLQLCLGKTGEPACAGADLDLSGTVNKFDIDKFQPCLSGDTIPFPPGCLIVP